MSSFVPTTDGAATESFSFFWLPLKLFHFVLPGESCRFGRRDLTQKFQKPVLQKNVSILRWWEKSSLCSFCSSHNVRTCALKSTAPITVSQRDLRTTPPARGLGAVFLESVLDHSSCKSAPLEVPGWTFSVKSQSFSKYLKQATQLKTKAIFPLQEAFWMINHAMLLHCESVLENLEMALIWDA